MNFYMVCEAVVDREIPVIVDRLLAHQRDAPIYIRIMSPIIGEVELPRGKNLSEKITKLIKFKNAKVTLIVNPWLMDEVKKESEYLQQLEEIGVKVHRKRKIHAKAILLESKRDKAILITSANFTESGFNINKEIGIYILNELCNIYDTIYNYTNELLKERKIEIS